MQFLRASQSLRALLSEGHTQSLTPLAGQCGHFIALLPFQPIALFLLSTPFQQVAIVQLMIGVAAKNYWRGGEMPQERY